jgi:hypothetical protein
VLAYLARYTHHVAISNSRLLGLDERGVTFRYKNYRRDGRARLRTMTLAPDEFIRRFLLHVLPKEFHRIRYCGLLASAKASLFRRPTHPPAPRRPAGLPSVMPRDRRRRLRPDVDRAALGDLGALGDDARAA